jgi:hypothetical protein
MRVRPGVMLGTARSTVWRSRYMRGNEGSRGDRWSQSCQTREQGRALQALVSPRLQSIGTSGFATGAIRP